MSGNKKKKIIFLNHWGKCPGGAEYSLMDIMEEAINLFECYLISTEEGVLTDFAKSLGVKIFIIPVNKNIANFKRDNLNPLKYLSGIHFIPYLIKVRKIIKQISPDLIHANVPKSHILLLLLYRTGIKIPGIIHMREIFRNKIILLLYTLLYNRRSKIISISNAVQKGLPKKLQRNSRIIYNGIKIPQNLPNIKNNKNIINLIYLGRIVPWKGCSILIKIFKRVKELDPKTNYKLNLYGDTSYWNQNYRNELKQEIKTLCLSDYCHIHNSQNDISSILNNSDIFVNASSEEPFGRVLAEASAHSLPVITFSSGGAKEIITNKTGILINDNSVEEFSQAIIKLSKNSELSKSLGNEGKKRAVLHFNREIQLKKILNFFKELSPK